MADIPSAPSIHPGTVAAHLRPVQPLTGEPGPQVGDHHGAHRGRRALRVALQECARLAPRPNTGASQSGLAASARSSSASKPPVYTVHSISAAAGSVWRPKACLQCCDAAVAPPGHCWTGTSPRAGPAHAAHRGPRGRAARARAGTQGLPSQPRSRPLRPPPGAAVCAPHGTAAGPVRLTLTLHCAPERARLASPARARRTRPPGRRSPAARPAARSRPRRARWARALRGAPGLALALPVGGARAPAPRLWQQDYGRRASVQRRPCRSTIMAAHPCTRWGLSPARSQRKHRAEDAGDTSHERCGVSVT